MPPLPTRLRLLKWGLNFSTEGNVIVNDVTLAGFAAFQRAYGREEVPLDFEHNTVPGTPEYVRSQEPRAIAAMGKPMVIAGEGIFLESLTWTETGKAQRGNYKDLSAAPWLSKAGVVLGLHSGALCRAGAVPQIHQFAAGTAADGARLVFLTAGTVGPAAVPTDPRLRVLNARLDFIGQLPFGPERLARTAEVRAELVAMQKGMAHETLEHETLERSK